MAEHRERFGHQISRKVNPEAHQTESLVSEGSLIRMESSRDLEPPRGLTVAKSQLRDQQACLIVPHLEAVRADEQAAVLNVQGQLGRDLAYRFEKVEGVPSPIGLAFPCAEIDSNTDSPARDARDLDDTVLDHHPILSCRRLLRIELISKADTDKRRN